MKIFLMKNDINNNNLFDLNIEEFGSKNQKKTKEQINNKSNKDNITKTTINNKNKNISKRKKPLINEGLNEF